MSQRIINDLLQTVGLIDRGRVQEKLNDEMGRLLEALQQHPEEKISGTITLTLKFTKLSDRMDVAPEVKTVLPKEKALRSATFWPAEGGLSVQHPSQHDMFGPRDASERRAERDFS
ncbi:hypothetical protein GCM10007301_15130 [Azorhizobium oxalatiphilum]|uniref:Uncharacterized protein n=1 Tax=Azorhizobium oxalatiphilum TaxID=980631 RepID=A0A917BRW8_9HYPH|nr:hypothetical protein [Azorhizobium oxalatiphilum]GGF56453.1 hypothetical protein GCM10007301_15130 [Azorhizobium oxalatiphilum]